MGCLQVLSPPPPACMCVCPRAVVLHGPVYVRCGAVPVDSVDGDCIPCPKNPGLLIGMFLTAIVFMCIAAWWFNQKKINMGIIAIGVDYFQVLCFRGFRVLAVLVGAARKWSLVFLSSFLCPYHVMCRCLPFSPSPRCSGRRASRTSSATCPSSTSTSTSRRPSAWPPT